MDKEEANYIIELLLSADNDCEHCASTMVRSFWYHFPEYRELAESLYKLKFKNDLLIDE